MKRIALSLFLFLLLGAIMNVAVAWTFSRATESSMPYASASNNDDDRAIIHSLRRHMIMQGMARLGSSRSGCAFGRERHDAVLLVSIPVIDQQQGHLVGITVSEYGWPLRALRHERWQEPRRPFFDGSGAMIRSTEDGISWDVPPLGFAINTIFYAAILWLLFAFPGVVRRRIRGHRGRCTACGYDLRGRVSKNKLCPECGVCV